MTTAVFSLAAAAYPLATTATLTPATGAPPLVSLEVLPDGHFHVIYAGTPGVDYGIEWAPSINGTWTRVPDSVTAAPNGNIEFDDTTEPKLPGCFYRAVNS